MQIKVGGVYRDRHGRKVKIHAKSGNPFIHWPYRGRVDGSDDPECFRENGSWGITDGDEEPFDLMEEWTDEPAAVVELPSSEAVSTSEPVQWPRLPSDDVAVFEPNRLRRVEPEPDPEPDPCDYRESAETLAAALRMFLRAMPETSPVNDPLIDAATFARLALDGYAP